MSDTRGRPAYISDTRGRPAYISDTRARLLDSEGFLNLNIAGTLERGEGARCIAVDQNGLSADGRFEALDYT